MLIKIKSWFYRKAPITENGGGGAAVESPENPHSEEVANPPARPMTPEQVEAIRWTTGQLSQPSAWPDKDRE
jgi:hypothetical protein